MATSIDWNQLSEEARNDRRRGKRVTLKYGLEVRGADDRGAFYACAAKTRNVSEHGCCFEIERKIKQGEIISLQVMRRNAKGEKESTRALIFRICWVVQDDGLWVAGAEMAEQEKPWGIAFPPKGTPLKSATKNASR
ncbi:MAG TPA: PilZ domain-containing protein [Candidatus Acidoferrum sp.]|nr:PilZ domain-containing protein [Candidatus Acidoferrum sp.]